MHTIPAHERWRATNLRTGATVVCATLTALLAVFVDRNGRPKKSRGDFWRLSESLRAGVIEIRDASEARVDPEWLVAALYALLGPRKTQGRSTKPWRGYRTPRTHGFNRQAASLALEEAELFEDGVRPSRIKGRQRKTVTAWDDLRVAYRGKCWKAFRATQYHVVPAASATAATTAFLARDRPDQDLTAARLP